MLKKFLSKKLFLAVIFITVTLSTPQPVQAGLWSWISSWLSSDKNQEPIFPISNASKASAHNQPATSYSSHSSWFSWFTSGSWNPFSWFFVSKKDDHAQTNAQESFNVNDGLEPKGHKTPLPKIEAQSMRQDTHNQEEKSANKRELFQELLKVSKDITSATNKFISNVGQEYQKHLQQNPEKKEASSDTSIIPSPKDFQPQLENIENDAQAQVGNQHHSLQQIPKETTVIQPTSHALVPLVNALRSTPQQQISLELPRTSTTLAARLTHQGILIQTIREDETIESLILINENLSRNLNIFWQNVLKPEEQKSLQEIISGNHQAKSVYQSLLAPEFTKITSHNKMILSKTPEQLQSNSLMYPDIEQEDESGDSFIQISKNEQAELAVQNHETYVFNTQRLTEHCINFAEKNGLNSTEYINFAKQQVSKGGLYASYVLQGHIDKVPQNTRQELLSSLVALNWYFYIEQLNKNNEEEGFEEGAFLIPKSFMPLFSRYLEMVKQEGHNINGGNSGPNPFAYYRNSSHLQKLTKNKHIGIDVCFSQEQGVQAMLPGGQRHLLVIDYDHDDLVYIKPENYGISNWEDTAHHGFEFIVAQARKTPIIQKTLGMKSDDDESYKKERIPADVKKAYQKLSKTHNLDEKAAEIGIFAMYKNTINHLKTISDTQLRKPLEEFTTKLEETYDHLDVRIGNEIILKDIDLFSAHTYYFVHQKQINNSYLAFAHLYADIRHLTYEYQEEQNLRQKNKLYDLIKEKMTTFVRTTQESIADLPSAIKLHMLKTKNIIQKSLQNDDDLKQLLRNNKLFDHSHQNALLKVFTTKRNQEMARKAVSTELQNQLTTFAKETKKTTEELMQKMDIAEDEIQQIIQELETGKHRNIAEFLSAAITQNPTLLHELQYLNNETTGLRKITEFRKILLQDFSSVKNIASIICKRTTALALYAYRNNKSVNGIVQLCKNFNTTSNKIFDSTIAKAHKHGFYTPRSREAKKLMLEKTKSLQSLCDECLASYESLKNKALETVVRGEYDSLQETGLNPNSRTQPLAQKYDQFIQNLSYALIQPIESFRNQIGFFENSRTLGQNIAREYESTRKTLERFKLPENFAATLVLPQQDEYGISNQHLEELMKFHQRTIKNEAAKDGFDLCDLSSSMDNKQLQRVTNGTNSH